MNNELLELYASGYVYFRAREIENAISVYKYLIEKYPDEAFAHTMLGICHLTRGDFLRGWPEFEWRLKTEQTAARPCGTLQWDGQPLNGKTILVLPEQGFGDTLQFARYMPHIKARGGRVLLGYRPALTHLLSTCKGVDQIVKVLPPHDVHVAPMSLPFIFQTSPETIPTDVPYLSVPPGVGENITKEIMRHRNVLRIGLAWKGGPKNSDVSHKRSLRPDQLKDLLCIPDVKFFSLPRWDGDLDVSSLPPGAVTDLGLCLSDLNETAAAIQALDLIISVDTTVVHLAGALGKPVWTLLPFISDWRWMLDREDSPWYPTMRLFRQPKPGNWVSVIGRVAEELKGSGGR